MRVGMCIGTLAGGGMGTVVDSLAKEFAKYGVKVEILTKKVLVEPPRKIPVHIVGSASANTLKLMNSYDIVHVNGGSTLTLLASQSIRPKMFTFHGQTPPSLHGGLQKQLKAHAIELLYRATMRKFDIVACTSKFGQEDIKKRYGIEKSVWIPNGVDRELFHKEGSLEVSRISRKYTHPLLLGVGNLFPVKGWDEMLDWYEQYLLVRPQATLLIAGGGVMKNSIEKRVSNGKLNKHVFLLDELPLGDLNNYYNACDAYVSGSPYEGFCLPAIEALSCGKPLIVRNRGAMIEHALSSGCGETFDGAKSFAEAAEKVLKMKPYEVERKANKYLMPFAWKNVALQYVKIYKKLVGR